MDEALLKKLKAAFAIEAEEHIDAFRVALDELATIQEPGYAPWLEKTFRSMHSLKGASRAVNCEAVELICNVGEAYFAILKSENRVPHEDSVVILHQAIDAIEVSVNKEVSSSDPMISTVVAALEGLSNHLPADEAPKNDGQIKQLDKNKPDIQKAPKAVEEQKSKPATTLQQERLRIDPRRLESIMQGVEDLLRVKLGDAESSAELDSLALTMAEAKRDWKKIAPILNKLEQSMMKFDVPGIGNALGLVEQAYSILDDTDKSLEPLETKLEEARHQARLQTNFSSRVVNNLQDQTRRLLLMPLDESLMLLNKAVRDISQEQGKAVDLSISGGNIEIDRRILGIMRDPFLHLVRNAVDHGIESPEVHQQLGKPAKATIRFAIDQLQSGRVRIRVSDDGGGLNKESLRRKVVDLGIATHDDVLTWSDAALFDMIFISGVTTAKTLTSISGRGLGMSIVREKAESVGGAAMVHSSSKKGTEFIIDLPVEKATFRGVLVLEGGRKFIFPIAHILHLMRVPVDEVKTVRNSPSVLYEKHALPLRNLASLLKFQAIESTEDEANILALVVQFGNSRLAVRVDKVIGEQEVLVKGLGSQLKSVRNIGNIAILGTGEAVPIINVGELLDTARSQGANPKVQLQPVANKSEKRKLRIMVAEDSFTSRMMLKNVLEASGYAVEVAVDGAAAYATLKTGSFDALISDVDMPRMNGFVLTERVRSDRKLSNLPVVLVTSLASNEDRERGIDAGANGYIVKSTFDQTELLSVLDRLLVSVN